jgi:hypothetical protein
MGGHEGGRTPELGIVFSYRRMEEEKFLSPWCLGVEAYTVMIKVYGKEARKGAGYGHNHRRFDRAADTGKHMVVGWGRMRRDVGGGGRSAESSWADTWG